MFCYHGKSGDGLWGSRNEQWMGESLWGAACVGSGNTSWAAWQLLGPLCVFRICSCRRLGQRLVRSLAQDWHYAQQSSWGGREKEEDRNEDLSFQVSTLPLASSRFKWTLKNTWNEPPQCQEHYLPVLIAATVWVSGVGVPSQGQPTMLSRQLAVGQAPVKAVTMLCCSAGLCSTWCRVLGSR